jgi:hypothetical protein
MQNLHWDRDLVDLMDHGLTITPTERAALDMVPEDSRATLLGLLRRAMTTQVPSTVVRYRAPHETSTARLEEQLNVGPWEISDDGTSFRHHGCDTSFGPYPGRYQAACAAADHHRQCNLRAPRGRHHAGGDQA